MINFGGWDPEMHLNDIEQIQRIAASQTSKIKKGIISYEKRPYRMTIQGSGAEPYSVTLFECTCSDFAIRKKPCKHIYALAFEVGLMDDFPKYNGKDAAFDKHAEAERYDNLFMSGDLRADDYVKIRKVIDAIK